MLRWPISYLAQWAVTPSIALVAAMQTIPVSIDLRPDDPPPTIVAPQSNGRIPVGLLTTETFDATTVTPASLRLGVTGTEAAPLRVNRVDLDGDGDIDLQLFFAIEETGVRCGDTTLTLTGRTAEGLVEGSGSIVTEGCG